jgi:phage shock protein B
MEDTLVPILICGMLFIGMPWVILHYVTKWKQAPKITNEDEKLLDELHVLARRLEDRLGTVERIIAADHPDWKTSLPLSEPTDYHLSKRN